MSKIDELINMLNDLEEVKRFKVLDEKIDKSYLKEKYKKLLSIQKQLVNAKYSNNEARIKEIEVKYNEIYALLESHPNLNEYLELQSEINDILKQITTIIEQEINTELI